MKVFLLVFGVVSAYVSLPRAPTRLSTSLEMMWGRKETKDEKMEKYYTSRFSDAAAQQYKFARERDKNKYSEKRKKTLGAKDGEEYDLEAALAVNTDDGILKIITGAFIAAVFAGLYIAVIAPLAQPPSFTDTAGITYYKDPKTGVFVEK